jgi:hypothetical protein
MTKQPMNYFAAISFRCNQLDEMGQKYLDKFEFLSNDAILNRLWKIAQKLFKDKCNEDWAQIDKIPDWAGNYLDGWIPYAPSRNGSLFYSMGYSVVSCDAHLRNLLERAEGREKNELDFPVVVEHDIVDKLSGLTK